MRIPEFSAESSLYNPKQLRRAKGTPLSGTGRHAVQPQIGALSTGGGAMEAFGCQFICIPNRHGAGRDCFWYCPGHVPLLTHPTEGLE